MKIYDTAQKQLVEFQPLHEGVVKMYVCGATVQDSPHIGHLRAAVAFDVFYRYLIAQGYRVEYVRNVTDIDDKVLQKAEQFDQQWFARAYYYEREFTAAYDLLNVLPPTYEPRATGQIPEMIEFIERLLSRGHAYKATDGIYFDVKSWPKYGELTHQTSEDALLSDRDLAEGKVDPRDFALWKFAKPAEPATAIWEAPFGKGRPGWHIECSTMCLRYL
jgi:cysteinyl-tRNA synthetase